MNEQTTSITSLWVASTSGYVNPYNVHLKTAGTLREWQRIHGRNVNFFFKQMLREANWSLKFIECEHLQDYYDFEITYSRK